MKENFKENVQENIEEYSEWVYDLLDNLYSGDLSRKEVHDALVREYQKALDTIEPGADIPECQG